MAFGYKKYSESDNLKKAKKKSEDYAEYTPDADVAEAKAASDANEQAKPLSWDGGSYKSAVDSALEKLNNRAAFDYNPINDPIYTSYKDEYSALGRLAMEDTIGKAAALTGGYGNSYAASAGAQAYQDYVTKASDVILELYSLAYERYNDEGKRLSDIYDAYRESYDSEYGEYRDSVSDWQNEQKRLDSRYDKEYDRDYSGYMDLRDYYYNLYNDERNSEYKAYSDDYDRAFTEYKQSYTEARNAADAEAESKSENSKSEKVYTIDDYNSVADSAVKYSDNPITLINYLDLMVDKGLITEKDKNFIYSLYYKDGGSGSSGTTQKLERV